MRLKGLGFALLVTLATSPLAAIAGPENKVEVCHKAWDGTDQVIKVSMSALHVHLIHGDVLASMYYFDGDRDGYGTSAGPTRRCEDEDYAPKKGDCDDTDYSVNPGAQEQCNDGIDNNCSGQVDEGCAACPCFATPELDAAWAEFQEQDWQSSEAECSNEVFTDPDTGENYDYVQVLFNGQNLDAITYEFDYWSWYSINWDGATDEAYCESSQGNYVQNQVTGDDSATSSGSFLYLTEEEHDECTQLLRGWAATNGLTCQ